MKAKHYAILISFSILLPLAAILADGLLGINEKNLQKIPIGLINLGLPDNDNDGIDNELEKAIGTNQDSKDTDRDGFSDKVEITNNYNPAGTGRFFTDTSLAKRLDLTYLLRVQKYGEIWIVKDGRRYFTGSQTRKSLLLARLFPKEAIKEDVIYKLADKIRSNDKTSAILLVSETNRKRVEYSMNLLGADQKLLWANILSSAILKSETENEKTYAAQVYFGLSGKNVEVKFKAAKQADGGWLITQL